MTEQEQVIAFSDDLDKLVDRYALEYDLTYAAIIGVLFAKATLLVNDAKDEFEEDI